MPREHTLLARVDQRDLRNRCDAGTHRAGQPIGHGERETVLRQVQRVRLVAGEHARFPSGSEVGVQYFVGECAGHPQLARAVVEYDVERLGHVEPIDRIECVGIEDEHAVTLPAGHRHPRPVR